MYLDKIFDHSNEDEGLVMINGKKIPVEKSRKSLLINEIEKYS